MPDDVQRTVDLIVFGLGCFNGVLNIAVMIQIKQLIDLITRDKR